MTYKLKKPDTENSVRPNADQWRQALGRAIPMIYQMYIKRRLNPALAEELTQKTVFCAVKGQKTYNPEKGPIENWLIGIAANNLAAELRRRANQPKAVSDLADYIETIDTEPLPDEILEKDETAQLVRAAMDQLQAKHQTVLRAKYIDDLPAREIAKKMNVTQKAVFNLLYRAKIALREKLKHIAPLNSEGQIS